MSGLVVFAICVVAVASVVVAYFFSMIAKALIANTESIRLLTGNLDKRLNEVSASVQKTLNEVNAITERVNGQMDRIENIVGNIEETTQDARTSMRMVNATVTPTLGNLHAIAGGLRKGLDTWRERKGGPPDA